MILNLVEQFDCNIDKFVDYLRHFANKNEYFELNVELNKIVLDMIAEVTIMAAHFQYSPFYVKCVSS